MSYGHFPAETHPLESLFVDGSHVFRTILLRSNSVYLFWWYSQNPSSSIHITVFQVIQNGAQSIMADSYDPVEHTELDLCVKFQDNQIYGVRCMAFPKLIFWALITAAYFLISTCTSFPVMGLGFMFLPHSSSGSLSHCSIIIIKINKQINNELTQTQSGSAPSLLEP